MWCNHAFFFLSWIITIFPLTRIWSNGAFKFEAFTLVSSGYHCHLYSHNACVWLGCQIISCLLCGSLVVSIFHWPYLLFHIVRCELGIVHCWHKQFHFLVSRCWPLQVGWSALLSVDLHLSPPGYNRPFHMHHKGFMTCVDHPASRAANDEAG